MSTRRQVAEIMMNLSFQAKDYNTMVDIIKSGFLSRDSVIFFLDKATNENSVFPVGITHQFLEYIGAENIPSKFTTRPVVKEWFLVEVRKSLLDLLNKNKWASVSKLPKYTLNPLLHAVFQRHMVLKETKIMSLRKKVRFLLKKGATMNSVVGDGHQATILQGIVFDYSMNTIDGKTFHKTLNEAIRLGANPQKRIEYFYGSKKRKGTLLHYYCLSAMDIPFNESVYDIIPTLEKVEVPVNALDSNGETALHYVAKRVKSNNQEPTQTILLEKLIEAGALIDIPNANGKTVRQMVPSHSFLFTMADLHRQTRSGKKRKRS